MTVRCVPLLLLALPLAAGADEPPAPDTSGWTCRFCQFEAGNSGWLAPSLGHVSASSFHFGDWTGRDDAGLVPDFDGALRLRAADSAQGWDLSLARLGLDSRALSLAGGRQGSYRLALAYEALPHLVADDGRTVFVGEEPRGLPPGWTRSGSTGGMTDLAASLHTDWLRTDRERMLLGAQFVGRRATELQFTYRRDEVRGTGATGGSFMTLAAELPRRIDQVTDRAEVSAATRGALGSAQLTLASSFFANDTASLSWQNPYNAPQPGADAGQLATAPDNQAHRLSLALALPAAAPLQGSARIAVGRNSQDARFLPATLNPNEAVTLPRASLDGRVDTLFASARAVYAFRGATRAIVDVLHDARDSRTPVDAYTQVVMDTFSGNVRSNAPYGYDRDRWRVSVEDRSVPRLRLGAGLENDARERHLHGTAATREQRFFTRVAWRPVASGDLRLRVAHAERDGNEFAATPAALAQNPALRAFNTADRRRDEARFDASFGTGRVTATFNTIYGRERYPSAAVGRTLRREFGYGADVSLQPVEALSLSVFGSQRLQDTEQAGSESFAAPDWLAEQEDATTVAGLHVGWLAPRGLEVGLDYVYSGSSGAIAMATGAGDTAFPTLVTRWHDTRAFARYPLRPDLSLRLDLLHERYQAADWQLDGVAADTVPNLLALGRGTPDADVLATLLSVRYEFRGEPPAD